MASQLPPDIDTITANPEWETLTPDQRNIAVDDWAIQARNAFDWSPEEIRDIDNAVDDFRTRALETFGEQAGRIVKDGAFGGIKSLAALPLSIPKVGLQSGKVLGLAADALLTGKDPTATAQAMSREAPELGKLLTDAEKTVQGAGTLAAKYNPFSGEDEEWEGEFDGLRQDVLERKMPEDPDELYDYLKKKAFTIAQKNARFYGGEPADYMPQEFQGANDEEIFKRNFRAALEGKRPEGFMEFDDDTVNQQGAVTRNQSRSLITSPENLGLLIKFSATRNPMYFEALKQRLGRSVENQKTQAMGRTVESYRNDGDFFDDAAQTIFGVGGYFPEAGETMKQEVRGLASSPTDIATTLFSFGLGKQAAKQVAKKNLLGTATSVAGGMGVEFLQGATSGLANNAIPELGNLAEEGLMEAVGGGVIQGAGAAVQGLKNLGKGQDYTLPDGTVVAADSPEAIADREGTEVAPLEEAVATTPLPEEVEVPLVIAEEIEPVAPLAAEALREEAELTGQELMQEEAVAAEAAVEEAPLEAEEEAAMAAPDFEGMSQDEYAAFVAENGPPEGVTVYDALTARPEQRGFTATQRADVFRNNEAAARGFTERMDAFWSALRATPIPGIKARGANSSWTNFEVNEDTHQQGQPRHKSYATLADAANLTGPELQGFMEALRDAGYKGQIKVPGTGSRALSSFDNVVMHGATQQDAVLGEQVARAFFGPRLTSTQFGVDQGGRSHTARMADEAEAKFKAKSNAPTVPNEQAGGTAPADASTPTTQVPAPTGVDATGSEEAAPGAPTVEPSPAQKRVTFLEGVIDRAKTRLAELQAQQSDARKSEPGKKGDEVARSYEIPIGNVRQQISKSQRDLDRARRELSAEPTAPDPVKQAVQKLRDWAQKRFNASTNPEEKARLQNFTQNLLPVLSGYEGMFENVQVATMPGGGGARADYGSRSLTIDPDRAFETLSFAETPQAEKAMFERMLDEEYRHSITLELEEVSPEFARNLSSMWDNLPQAIKDESAAVYFQETGARYSSPAQARHEFFRQYWQKAEMREMTEEGLRSEGALPNLARLIDSFIKALKALREGALPNVKTILDRLIAQATERSDQIKQEAKTRKQQAQKQTEPKTQEAPAQAEPKAAETATEPEETTSLKRAVVDAEREARGELAIPTPTTRGWNVAEQEAAKELEQNPNAGYDLVTKIKARPRALSDTENALLLFHKVRLDREITAAGKAVAAAKTETESAEAKAIYDAKLNDYNDVDVLSRAVGTEAGRSLNARKMRKALDRRDISLATLMQEYRTQANLGKALSAEEKDVVEKNAANLEKKFDALEAAQAEEVAAQAEPVERKLEQEAREEAATARKQRKEGYKKILKDKEKEARARIKARKEGTPPPLNAPAAPKRDAEYFASIENGDIAAQQAVVDQTAEAAGFDTERPLYHYGAEGVTEFRSDYRGLGNPADQGPAGTYLSPDSNKYSGFEKGGSYKFYAKLDNPATLDTPLTRRHIEEAQRQLGPEKASDRSQTPWSDWLAELEKTRAETVKRMEADAQRDAQMDANKGPRPPWPGGISLKSSPAEISAQRDRRNRDKIAKTDKILDWKNQPLDAPLPISLLTFLDKAYYGNAIMRDNGEATTGNGVIWQGAKDQGMSLEEKAALKRNARDFLVSQGFDGVDKTGQLNSEDFIVQGLNPHTDFFEVIAFRPDQIKSAEAVTRDASGEIIPPSQRFNVQSPSILYSPAAPQRDAEYMAAVEADDMAKAQEMVGEAGKSAGYVGPWFHGGQMVSSKATVANTDGEGFFLARNANTAGGYGDVAPFFFKQDDFFDPTNASHLSQPWVREWIDFWRQEDGWVDRRSGEEMSDGEVLSMIERVELFEYEGAPRSERWTDFLRTAREHHDGFRGYDPTDSSWIAVVFSPNQIKSADPVTYDSSGKVIPLSQRFNPAQDSFLYSPSAPQQDDAFQDYAIVGASLIDKGATTLEKFSAAMTKAFGQLADLPALFDRAKEIRADAVDTAQRQAERAEKAATPAGVLEAGKKRLEGKETAQIDRKLAADLFKSYVKSRPSMSAEEINTEVTKDLQAIYPKATESDVRVAITDYGKAKFPSQDALKKRIRQGKEELRLAETLERVERGEPGLKSGLQRDKPSARARELRTKVNEAMKRMKLPVTREDQIASLQKSIKTRLENQIEDLNRVIEGKSVPKAQRETFEYTEELNKLVQERDALKALVAERFGPSPAERWNASKQRGYRAAIENLRRRIAQSAFEARAKASFDPDTTTEKLREELEATQNEFRDLRELTGIPQAERLEAERKALQKQITTLEERIQTGVKPPAGKPKVPAPQLEGMRQQLKALRQTVKAVEGTSAQSEAKRAEAAERGLRKSLAEMDRKIKQNDLRPKERRTPVQSETLTELRRDRDQLSKILAAMQELAVPRRTAPEIALANFKRRVEKQRAEAEQALERQEYLEVPEERPYLAEKRKKAMFELNEAKRAWNTELLNRRLAARTPIQKILGTAGEVLNLSRAILTSVDLSAPLRQGSFIVLANPRLAAKSFAPMFKSLFSKQAQDEAMDELKSRPNFPLYEQSGLYLSDLDDTTMQKMEEAFFSRWVDKIPTLAGGEIIRGSQRAYITFLNKLRADTFDALKETLGRDGRVTVEEGKQLASFINVATGRGIIGSSKSPQGNSALATVFFSPKLVASRFNLLAGQPLYGGNARTRKLIAKQYLKFLTGVGVSLGLLALMRDDDDDSPIINTEPTSSDFMKIRMGNTRIDMFGGLLQATVLLSRIIKGETTKVSGDTVPIRGEDKPFSAPSTGDVIWRFTRSKFSPAIGALMNILDGEDYAGKPTGLKEEAMRMAVPMSIGSVRDVMQELPIPQAVLTGLLSIFGAGVQTYKEDE